MIHLILATYWQVLQYILHSPHWQVLAGAASDATNWQMLHRILTEYWQGLHCILATYWHLLHRTFATCWQVLNNILLHFGWFFIASSKIAYWQVLHLAFVTFLLVHHLIFTTYWQVLSVATPDTS